MTDTLKQVLALAAAASHGPLKMGIITPTSHYTGKEMPQQAALFDGDGEFMATGSLSREDLRLITVAGNSLTALVEALEPDGQCSFYEHHKSTCLQDKRVNACPRCAALDHVQKEIEKAGA